MSLIAEALSAVVSTTRELDGRIWDYPTQKYLPPTTASQAAADTAVDGVIDGALDLIPFPISTNVMGIFTLDITRTKMEAVCEKIRVAVKAYVVATRQGI